MLPTIYIPICDDNLWVLDIYSFLFKKFWGNKQKVVWMGFKKPEKELPKNFTFVSLAEKQEGGSTKWTRYIHDYLVSIDDEYIIFSLEDFFPTGEPNWNILSELYGQVKNDKTIGRCDIAWDSFITVFSKNNPAKMLNKYKIVKKNENYSVIDIPKEAPYRVSTQPAIWRRDYLLRFLDNDWNPWQFEEIGTALSRNTPDKIIAVADGKFQHFPTKWIHKGAVSRFHEDKINVLGLDVDTIKELVDEGLVQEDKLQWGQWNGPVPGFKELGGYDFHPVEMPKHEASSTNWKEYYNTYHDPNSDTMVVNLIDSNFSHTRDMWGFISCQAERPIRTNKIKYIPKLDTFLDYSGITIFTDHHLTPGIVDRVRTKHKIAWILEPPEIHPWAYRNVERSINKFDFVFTLNKQLSEKYDNCILFPYSHLLIQPEDWGIHEKTKLFTTIASGKNHTSGHKMRHEVIKQLSDKHSIDTYGRGYAPFPEHGKINCLKDYMFSVVVENTMLDTMYCKIVDSFIVGTIPIYWGTKEVRNDFDPEGVIFFDSVEELDEILSNLTEQDYYSRMAAVKNNFEITKGLWRTEDKLVELINNVVFSREGIK